MDLVSGSASKIIVTMDHTTNGKPNIVDECTLPITGKNCVNTIITDMVPHKSLLLVGKVLNNP